MADDILRFSDFEESNNFKNEKEKEFLTAIFQGVLQYAEQENLSLDRFVELMEILAVKLRDNYEKIKREQGLL